MTSKQRELASHQVSEFYHDDFVTAQVKDFRRLVRRPDSVAAKVVDIGGGVGYFADALGQQLGFDVTVLDMDTKSLEIARSKGLRAELGDALSTRAADDAQVVSFNLVLHHLVTGSWRSTLQMQQGALRNQLSNSGEKRLFVNEYVYESYVLTEFAAWLIFTVTSSRMLSRVASIFARLMPTLRANTFGVGVCFHSDRAWRRLFDAAGWTVEAVLEGEQEGISAPRRIALALRKCRRNSYILKRTQ